jgi:phosphoenolpyruvate synthase/pyruvate phosphate dikinase
MQLYKSSFIPVSISPSESEKQKLSDSQIATIALLCKDIARVLHFPFRMKWVLEKGNLYIIDIKKHTP